MKQLELFENLVKEIPEDELNKLKALAISPNNDNILLCASILQGHGYSELEQVMFIIKEQLLTIDEDEWIEDCHAGCEQYKMAFSVCGLDIDIYDGSMGYDLLFCLVINGDFREIWDYTELDNPTTPSAEVRKMQLDLVKDFVSSVLNSKVK